MPSAFSLVGPRQLELSEYDDPPLGPRDVLIEGVLSGISHGTEMNLYRGTAPFAEKHFDGEHRLFMPNEEPGFRQMRLGYEMVGRVVEVGREVSDVKAGDLVHTATPHRPTTVVDMDANASSQIPMQVLPGAVTPDEAVFSALIGVALVAIHDAQIKLGDHVAVVGLGTIGLIVAQMARLNGAMYVAAVDPIAKRREAAAALGVDEVIDPAERDPGEVLKFREGAPRGADVVIEASGHNAGVQTAIRCAHMGGTIATLGYYQGGATPVRFGEEWHHNRVTMISSMAVWGCPSRFHPMWDRPRATRTVFDILDRGLVLVDELITHRFSYEEAPQAYQLVDQHPEECIKVVLTYQ